MPRDDSSKKINRSRVALGFAAGFAASWVANTLLSGCAGAGVLA